MRHDDEGIVRAVRDAVPTSRHAAMLFTMVADLLGAEAHVESADEGTRLVLFRRARVGATSYVPWPLVSLRIGGRLSHIVMIRGPEEDPAESARGPGGARVRGAGPGELIVHDGPHSVTVTYGADGGAVETARSESVQTFAGVIAALARRSARPVELVADFVAGIDIERHGPGTVFMPVALPGALRGVWVKGLRAIRHALFHGRVPDDARWVAVDGYDGIALATGATRAAALTRWRAEVDRLRPAPPIAAPRPDAAPPPGAMVLKAPRADGVRPDPALANTPAVVLRLDGSPGRTAPFGDWTRLVDRFGTTVPAAIRRDVAGFTLVGDKLVEELDADALAQLDEALADVAFPPLPELPGDMVRPDYNCRVATYRVIDERTRVPVEPKIVATSQCHEFDPAMLEAESTRWHVVRQRWLDLE